MATASMRHTRRCIIVFGRYPVPGVTKTRLIPLLGPVGAADLQRHLTETTLDTALDAGPGRVWFCHAGGTAERLKRWLGPRDLEWRFQAEGDLGRRMAAALQEALACGYRRVVLVGTDVPEMSARHLHEAFDALEDHDLVLGPSRDGGYWLIGVRAPVPVFEGIAWGTDQVLAQTLAAAGRAGLSAALLPPLNDIDTEADFLAWPPHGRWQRPYMSVVLPVLNEADRITATLERAGCPDAQLIVVDGGSRDTTIGLAEAAGARVIGARCGRAEQQNCGARIAKGRVLLFLHADTQLPVDYAARVFDTLLDPRVAAGAFGFKTDLGTWSMGLIERAAHIRSRLFRLPYGDQGLFMRKGIFDRAGGFPDIPIAEDLFLVRHLARFGRIELAAGKAVTSGRRWRRLGVWRTTLINTLIAGGCLLGVNPKRLARLYRLGLNADER
jgi:uncharacterized protein